MLLSVMVKGKLILYYPVQIPFCEGVQGRLESTSDCKLTQRCESALLTAGRLLTLQENTAYYKSISSSDKNSLFNEWGSKHWNDEPINKMSLNSHRNQYKPHEKQHSRFITVAVVFTTADEFRCFTIVQFKNTAVITTLYYSMFTWACIFTIKRVKNTIFTMFSTIWNWLHVR